MLVLKIAAFEWENASRDKRELSACEELGMETAVLAKGEPDDRLRQDEVAGFRVYRASTRPLGTGPRLNPLNRVVSLFTWASQARELKPDIISGHNITGLLIGWLSNFGRRRKAKLVYDSHEFELGSNNSRGRAANWCVCRLERFLMKRCAFSIMVNDAIADEVQRIHGLKQRPIVVRSTPTYWELDADKTAAARAELLSGVKKVPEDPMILLYHGSVTSGRGIENVLRTVARLPYTVGAVLGDASGEAYGQSLRKLAEELGVEDRVVFHPAVSIDRLRQYVSGADVGMVTVLPLFRSYYYMLPNKFFECIQSETPVIVSDFPSVGQIVDRYGIGLKADPEDVDAIAAAVERMRTDRAFYEACKAHMQQAKAELCWEKEKEVMLNAYRELIK